MLDNLENILLSILNKIDKQNELLQLSISNLNTKKAVASCLNKSTNTIDNYIKNGTFVKDKHYFFNENGKIEFMPLAILEFKKTPKINTNSISMKSKNITHSAISSILKGISHE